MKMPTLAFALTVLAGSASAQDANGLFYDFGPTASCLASAQSLAAKQDCVGRAAEACIEKTGYATPVLSGCASRELEDWDVRLNAVYQQQRAYAREFDMGNDPNLPGLDTSLRDMQRAWIPYRDATCVYEAAQWSGGTGAGPAYIGCLLSLTGDQALYLEFGRIGG